MAALLLRHPLIDDLAGRSVDLEQRLGRLRRDPHVLAVAADHGAVLPLVGTEVVCRFDLALREIKHCDRVAWRLAHRVSRRTDAVGTEVRDISGAPVGAHDHLVRSAANGKLCQRLSAIGIDERSGVLRFVQNDERRRARGQCKRIKSKQSDY